MPARRTHQAREAKPFGTCRPCGSGRWQALYMHPDPACRNPERKDGKWKAPDTFESEEAGRRWLRKEKDKIDEQLEKWTPPVTKRSADRDSALVAPIFAEYADAWITRRLNKGNPLAESTQKHYRMLLRREIVPTLGHLPITAIDKAVILDWHQRTDTTPDMRCQSYVLVSSVLRTAVREDRIAANPCTIPGASSPPSRAEEDPLSEAEIMKLAGAVDERYAAVVLVMGFSGLRFHEMAQLRHADVDLEARKIRIRKSKSPKGRRVVPIFPETVEVLRRHKESFAGRSLMFVARDKKSQLGPSSVQGVLEEAAKAVGIEVVAHLNDSESEGSVHSHLLRHSAATNLVRRPSRPNAADIMHFLGHATEKMALHYMHSNSDRLVELTASDYEDRLVALTADETA